jgi:tetratricopeptide (TPR) repeat protein
VRFALPPTAPPAATARWEFGNGLSATGATVEHIYTALGRFPVTVTAGGQSVRWPLEVFEIENVTEQFPRGDLKAYARAAASYDRAALNESSLVELAALLVEAGDLATAQAVGLTSVSRFPQADPARRAAIHKLIGDCALAAGPSGVETAITHYQAALAKEAPLSDRLDALAKLIRLYGIETNQPDKVAATQELLDAVVRGERFDERTAKAYQRAMIVLGDAFLWHGQTEPAHDYYLRAERQRGVIPFQVRQAHLGAYPGTLRQYLAAGQFDAGFALLDRWEQTYPTDKVKGASLYWRGKFLIATGDHRSAARHLARAIGLAPGASFETEARWLLAETLTKLGRTEEAKVELAKLVKLGVADDYTAKAKAQLTGR